jgi:AraC family transcriptional regulator, ethanolamine operon transcriptional activator
MDRFSGSDTSFPVDAPTHVGSFITEDPWAHEQATSPWDTLITPLSREPYRHAVTFLASSGLILYREDFLCRTRVQGLSPAGMFCFAVPLKIGSNTSWWGSPLHDAGLPAMMPGGAHTEFSKGHRHLMALVDLGLFRDNIPADLQVAIEAASRQHVIPATHDAVARLGATLNALLDETQVSPDLLDHPRAVRAMEENLLAAFRHALALHVSSTKRPGRAYRQNGLRRAVEYLRSTDPGSVTIADLCATAQVTQRTLEYAFQETFGLSPLALLNLRRYHAARRELIATDGGTATVRNVALNNGIYHMGRFAFRYKALFGESPSCTLKRPPEKGKRALHRPGGHLP